MQKVINKAEWEYEWERCKPFIEKAVKHQDSYTIDDIEDKIRHGLFHLWPGKESAFVTEIIIFPQEMIMNLLFCGGKFEELKDILESIEVSAKSVGIKKLIGGGRKGWTRKLKDLGFKQEYLIGKEI